MRVADRWSRVVSVACAAMVGLVLFGGGSASASPLYGFQRSFGSFGNVESLAVDPSTGDVYVYDASGAGAIYRFDPSGNPVEFSATGSNGISGVGASPFGPHEVQMAVDSSTGATKGDIYVANSGDVGIYGSDGEFLGELNGNVSSEIEGAPWGVPCGVAVDTQGQVYVGLWSPGDNGNASSAVNRYTPVGEGPATNSDYTGSLKNLTEICNVAADSKGGVYTDQYPNGPLIKYQTSQSGALDPEGTLTVGEGHTPFVDLLSDELYVDMGSEIQVFDAQGNPVGSLSSPTEPQSSFGDSNGVAANGASGQVYVSDNEHGRIVAFGAVGVLADASTGLPAFKGETAILKGTVNPNGVEAACHFEYGTDTSYGHVAPCASAPGSGSEPVEVSAEVDGLQPGTEYHYRLVAESPGGSKAGKDVGFSPQVPFIRRSWAVGVKVTTATVEGEVDPMGHETSFLVEYGTDSSYGSRIPLAAAGVGSGSSATRVKEELSDLRPGTTYHYRISATNEYGTVEGPDGSFTTSELPRGEEAEACPNAVYRVGASANLPDCRAYEMVSPVDKNGADVNAQQIGEFLSSPSGERLEFPSHTSMADSHSSGAAGFNQYIASRGADGWTTKAIMPEVGLGTPFDPDNFVPAFSEDLDRGLALGYALPGVSGALPNTDNLYLEDTSNAQPIEALTRNETGVSTNAFLFRNQLHIGGASSDLGVVSFETPANLVPQASGNEPKLYVAEHGRLELAGVLPDGTVPSGGSSRVWKVSGFINEDTTGLARKDTVSADGSRVLFVSPAEGSTAQLYMRRNGTETVWISQSESTTSTSEATNVEFQMATPDDRHVLFTTETPLLDSDPGGSGTGLYMYTDSAKPETEPNLTFIGRFEPPRPHPAVQALSSDGSHVYFAAASGTLPFEVQGQALFLWTDGHIKQIAPSPGGGGFEVANERPIVSADGKRLVFMNERALVPDLSILSLSGENRSRTHTFTNSELYLYDEDADSLKCVSCPPSGAAVTVGVEVEDVDASSFPAAFEIGARPRYFSQDGKYVFFNTVEGLLPQDTNNLTDAYEYNVETGKLSLLSPGTGEYETWFVEASPDGRDAFLVTREQLKRQDPDKLVDVYDARVDGGQPEPSPPSTPCAGDACQGTPSAAPTFNTASGFKGRGNPTATPPKNAKARAKPRRALTRAQKLKRALKACKHKSRHRRARCRAVARKRYAKKPAQHAGR